MLSEARRGERKIGTTSRGIGPAYEDKIGRRGIRVCDLVDTKALADEVRENVNARNQIIKDSTLDWKQVYDQLLAFGERMRRWTGDVSLVLDAAMQQGQRVLFEGAQGAMLDIDHGTYPYVTSSNATDRRRVHRPRHSAARDRRRARRGQGVHHARRRRAVADRAVRRDGRSAARDGQEYGASTGRPRRCGWYDAVAVRYAVRVNGIDSIALTKLDVLDGLETIEICTGYRIGGRTVTEFPSDLNTCGPYHAGLRIMAGLDGADTRARGLSTQLPAEAQQYIGRLEEVSGVPVGSDLDRARIAHETIIRRDSVVAKWLPASR